MAADQGEFNGTTAEASSSSVADAVKMRIVTHMNLDHTAELALYLRHHSPVSYAGACSPPELLDIATEGMTIRGDRATSLRDAFVPFVPPLSSLNEARVRLVAMATESREALGLDELAGNPAVTRTFLPPTGFPLVVFLGVTTYFICAAIRPLVVPGTALWIALDSFFPLGAPGFRWIVAAIWWPVLGTHVAETAWFEKTRLQKFDVEQGSWTWCLWIGCVFLEGLTAFKRFDTMVEDIRKAKVGAQGKKH